MNLVDIVAETVRQKWSDVTDFGVIEFLNIICYRIDKTNQEKAEMNKRNRIKHI